MLRRVPQIVFIISAIITSFIIIIFILFICQKEQWETWYLAPGTLVPSNCGTGTLKKWYITGKNVTLKAFTGQQHLLYGESKMFDDKGHEFYNDLGLLTLTLTYFNFNNIN